MPSTFRERRPRPQARADWAEAKLAELERAIPIEEEDPTINFWSEKEDRSFSGGYLGKARLSSFERSEMGEIALRLRMGDDRGKAYWAFRGKVYLADDRGLEADDVLALLTEKETRRRRRIKQARTVQGVEERGEIGTRVAIPREVRYAVWERDAGKCAECGFGVRPSVRPRHPVLDGWREQRRISSCSAASATGERAQRSASPALLSLRPGHASGAAR